MDYNTANCTVHLLFLVESLLLEKVVPVVRPGVRPKRINSIVENVRPHGLSQALEAVRWLRQDRAACMKAINTTLQETALRTISPETFQELITEEDLAHIYDLLLIVEESRKYLKWGDGRRFF